MKRSRLLLASIIFILIVLFASVPLFNQFVYGAQNLSADSISDLNGYYVNGGSSYDALSDGDICFVFKAGSDREFVLYIYDEDSGQTEDSDMYIKPDYYSSGRSYTGTGRWVKMSVSVNALSAESIQDDLISKADFADEDWGDMSVSSNVVTLDNDVVAPAEMADADHGDFTYSSGVASLDSSVVGNTEIDANAILHISGLGIGDSSSDAPLEVLSTTTPQVRITNTDDIDDMDISVDPNGDADIQISGDNLVIQNDTDGTTGFQILDADGGTPILNVDTTNERVGIGTASPSQKLHVYGDGDKAKIVVDGEAVNTEIVILQYGGTAGSDIDYEAHRARGTRSSPTAVQRDDEIATFGALGHDGTSFNWLAEIKMDIDQNVSTGVVPGVIRFFTTDTSGNRDEAMRIDSSQNVGIGTTPTISGLELYRSSEAPILAITGAHNTSYDPQIKFRTDATPSVKFSLGVDAADDKFKIMSGDGVGDTTEFVIDTSGNVGIGTADPNHVLNVVGNAQIDGNIILSNMNSSGVLYSDNSKQIKTTSAGSDGQVLVSNEGSSPPNWEYIPRHNLLTNTQWIACFNSDSAKGIGAMTFDAGSTAAPTAGLTIMGLTSSATGKLMTVTLSTGAWDANDATGTMTLGSCSERFHDGEEIYWTGGYATVNKPDSAAGVDKIQNGEFSVDTDPPPGWTAGNSATLTTEAGGKVGNCLMVTCDGTNDPYAYQRRSVTAGKNYYFTCYIKAGTEATYVVVIRDYTNSTDIYHSGSKEETAGDWSTSITRYFTAPAGCTQIEIRLFQIHTAGGATTMYFDEISCYEVTRCCTGADNLDFDGGWYKDTTLDVYYQFNDGGTFTHDGCFGSLKCVPSAANDFRYWPNATRRVLPEWYQQFAGRTVTFAVGCLSSTASHAFIQLIDSDTTDYDQSSDSSSYHTGDGTWQWLEKTITVSASTTEFSVAFVFDQSAGITYFTMPMFSFGSSIGAWNYVPESDRRIYAEKPSPSQVFNDKTSTNGFSDVGSWTKINLEPDSLACIGKGAKAVKVRIRTKDSGSAGTNTYFIASPNGSVSGEMFGFSLTGLANDSAYRYVNWIPCGSDGNYEYQIEASGSNTFDMEAFQYIGIEW